MLSKLQCLFHLDASVGVRRSNMAGSQTGALSLAEEFMTCSICMELYRRPKILPCLHTFCSDCLKSYIITSGAAVNSRKKAGFPCPTCRQHVPIAKPTAPLHTWPDLLKDNFVMANMMESLARQQHAAPPPPPPPTPTSDHCNDPASRLGEDCEGTGCTCQVSRVALCWGCQLFLCSYCSSKHAACGQVEKVEEAGPRGRQEMLDWLPPLHDLSCQLHVTAARAQTLLQALQTQRDVTHEQISRAARRALEMVRLQEQQLKLELDASYGPRVKRQQQAADVVSRVMDSLQVVREELQRAVLEDDVTLLRQAPALKKRYNDVTKDASEALGDVRRREEEGEEEEDVVSFTPTALSRLRTTVLVGACHHTADRQPSDEPPTSPSLMPSAQQDTASSDTTSSPVTSPEPVPPKTSLSRSASSASEILVTRSDDTSSNTSSSVDVTVTSSGMTPSCLLTEGPTLRLSPSLISQSSSPSTPSTPIPLTPQSLSPADMTSSLTVSADGEEQTTDTFSLSSPLLLTSQREVTCRQTLTFPAKVKGDRTQPLIRDLVVVDKGWVVAVDTANRCVKTFFFTPNQQADGKCQCKRLSLAAAPHGLAVLEGCCVAVTVPKERHVLLLAVRPHLVPLSTLPLPPALPHPLWAVTALSPQRLALTTCPQGQGGEVVILQVRGEGLEEERRYSSPVKTPLYLAACGTSLLLADPTDCHVACVTAQDGRPVFARHTDGKATGVASYAHTLLLVDQSPALTLLTNEGRFLHTVPLPTAGKNSCSMPRAVAVATQNTIYISDEHGRIHQLELCWQQS